MTIKFQHRCVQDLAWVIASPPVISGIYNQSLWLDSSWCKQEFADCLPFLMELDQNPEPLRNALATLKTTRLGERFECFIAFWLSISPNFQLLVRNKPIRHQKQTLGELDFVIREINTDKIIHLEVAVKFYLGNEQDINSMAGWYGPGLHDKLDEKYSRLTTHQTTLARKYPELMPHAINESWCMVKGRMFYPIDSENHPAFFAKDHLHGNWFPINEKPTGDTFIRLHKTDWLAEITSGKETEVLPENIGFTQCYVELDGNQETRRFFLLPDKFWAQINHAK